MIKQNCEDIRSIRDEINWRVKVAYTSNVALYSIIITLAGLLAGKEPISISENGMFYSYIGITISIVLAMFVAILNANHLIIKRIELYTLKLQKVNIRATKKPIFSWLSFLYSDVYKSRLANFLVDLVHGVFGFFQYFFPNLFALLILVKLSSFCGNNNIPKLYFILGIVIVIISLITSFVFIFFFFNVRKKHKRFFEKFVKKYYSKSQR